MACILFHPETIAWQAVENDFPSTKHFVWSKTKTNYLEVI
jgi:hypothetical protein